MEHPFAGKLTNEDTSAVAGGAEAVDCFVVVGKISDILGNFRLPIDRNPGKEPKPIDDDVYFTDSTREHGIGKGDNFI
jgi:hypothetical protein